MYVFDTQREDDHDEDEVENPLPNDLPPLGANFLRAGHQRGAAKREYISLLLWNNRLNNARGV